MHITFGICISISIGCIPRNELLGQRIHALKYLIGNTKLHSKRLFKITYNEYILTIVIRKNYEDFNMKEYMLFLKGIKEFT